MFSTGTWHGGFTAAWVKLPLYQVPWFTTNTNHHLTFSPCRATHLVSITCHFQAYLQSKAQLATHICYCTELWIINWTLRCCKHVCNNQTVLLKWLLDWTLESYLLWQPAFPLANGNLAPRSILLTEESWCSDVTCHCGGYYPDRKHKTVSCWMAN